MKSVRYMVIFVVFILACTSQEKQSNKTEATDSLINTAGRAVDSSYQEGARLVAANDCLTCHKVEEKSVGPSYNAISEKYHFYEGNVENLAHSIIHGSKGLWGDQAMTPHPTITYNDAKEMARYILSLKNTPSNQENGK